MNECNVCYTNIQNPVHCFGSCNFIMCLPCFNAMLKLNADIEYCCPMCRITSVKNKDRRFTTFVNSHKSTLKKIVSLYETRNVNHAWCMWNDISYSIYENQLFHLTPELAELSYIGHTHDFIDNLPD